MPAHDLLPSFLRSQPTADGLLRPMVPPGCRDTRSMQRKLVARNLYYSGNRVCVRSVALIFGLDAFVLRRKRACLDLRPNSLSCSIYLRCCLVLTTALCKPKPPPEGGALIQIRRGRDSNPRYRGNPVRRFSKPLPSAARPPLRTQLG